MMIPDKANGDQLVTAVQRLITLTGYMSTLMDHIMENLAYVEDRMDDLEKRVMPEVIE